MVTRLMSNVTALMRLRGTTNVEDEINEMAEEGKTSLATGRFSIAQLLKAKDLRLALIIAIVLQVAQQLSGINAVST